ncbi:L domain-like protein [Rhizoclosmatium globosum]|uniref:L domain-like protein n=1 Tax=Rhizoclosmatium globosum TaxID=329046 RepID=A0A1Y2CB07_9FUNG|nr:L domain-like protein [Rhizoclosmatium globosum]|eukprot:ORY44208.1 L domain-like protein [Rhizoclosmatium globosum]
MASETNTRIPILPTELIHRIFVLLAPFKVPQYKLISKHMLAILSDPYFLHANFKQLSSQATALTLSPSDRNWFSGCLPHPYSDFYSTARLLNVNHLFLKNRKLIGELPSFLGVSSLVRIHLGDNKLNGSIPPSFGTLVNLKYLNLGGNRLSGEIPRELGNLRKLTF